jgi:hypothetical protein
VLRTSPLSTATLGFSLGYFATDLVLLVHYYPAFGGPEMALHHVAAIASVAAAAFQARQELAALLWIVLTGRAVHEWCTNGACSCCGACAPCAVM